MEILFTWIYSYNYFNLSLPIKIIAISTYILTHRYNFFKSKIVKYSHNDLLHEKMYQLKLDNCKLLLNELYFLS